MIMTSQYFLTNFKDLFPGGWPVHPYTPGVARPHASWPKSPAINIHTDQHGADVEQSI